jgi:transcription elongation factor GreB
VFFGATVTICDEQGMEQTYQIVGVDETDFGAWPHQLGVAAGARAAQGTRGRCGAFPESRPGWREVEVLAVEYRPSTLIEP